MRDPDGARLAWRVACFVVGMISTPQASYFARLIGVDPQGETAGDSEHARALRADMIADVARDVGDRRVLRAMALVPRHLFVDTVSTERAYWNMPQPIGYEQTISQPTIVAVMTEALALEGQERVLEIGTGSGYQAAVLSLLAAEVYSIEVVPELAQSASERLVRLGYTNVRVRAGDGYAGWPDAAPFDRIILTAAPDEVPQSLLDQLAEGGILVAPIGPNWDQQLVRYHKRGTVIQREVISPVRFVPMVHG